MYNFAGEKLEPEVEKKTVELFDFFLTSLAKKKNSELGDTEYGIIFFVGDDMCGYLLPINDEYLGDCSVETSFHNMINERGGNGLRRYVEKMPMLETFEDGCQSVVEDVAIFHETEGGLPTESRFTLLCAIVAACLTKYQDRIILDHNRRIAFINCPLGAWA